MFKHQILDPSIISAKMPLEALIIQVNHRPVTPEPHIDELHHQTESNGSIDITFIDLLVKTLGDEHHPDHDQKSQGKDLE